MTDTTTTQDFAKTLGTAVHVALQDGSAARQAILDMRIALDAGDMEKVTRIIRSQTPDGGQVQTKLISVKTLIYESLPRGGDQRSYG